MNATRLLALCLLVLPFEVLAQPCPSPDAAGIYSAGWRTVTVQRGNRTLNCRLYYPARNAGQNVAAYGGGGPYPMLAFGHGFFMQSSYYNSYFEHLATRGYITIAPQFPDTQHGELALDLLACIDYLRQANGNSSHFLSGVVDTSKAGLSGHSMGGGASLLAASYDSRILAVAPMCPAETTPSCISRMSLIAGAVCIIAGSADGITSVSAHQQPMYNAADPFKSLAVLQGGNHTRCMDVATFDWTDPNGTMTRSEQQTLTRRYMTAVFDYFLKADTCGGSYSYGINAPHPDVQLSFETGPQWPVELGDFSVQRQGGDVLLRWTTETETRNYGFEIQRSHDGENFNAVGFVEGAGSSTARRQYEYIDRHERSAWYRLRQIDLDGTTTILRAALVGAGPAVPVVFPTQLHAGVPGRLEIPETSGEMAYLLTDTAGRIIAAGSTGNAMDNTSRSVSLPIPPLSSGIYFLVLQSSMDRSTHRLLVF